MDPLCSSEISELIDESPRLKLNFNNSSLYLNAIYTFYNIERKLRQTLFFFKKMSYNNKCHKEGFFVF